MYCTRSRALSTAKPASASRGADHVLHRRGHLAAGFQTDFLRALRELGDRVARVDGAMPGPRFAAALALELVPGFIDSSLSFLGHLVRVNESVGEYCGALARSRRLPKPGQAAASI